MSYSSKPNQSSYRSLRWSVCSQSKADLLLFPVVDCIILSSLKKTLPTLHWIRIETLRFVSIISPVKTHITIITCMLTCMLLRRPLRIGSPQMKSFGPSGSGSSRGMIVGWPSNKSMFRRFSWSLLILTYLDISSQNSEILRLRVGQVGLFAWQCILRLPKISNVSNSVSDVTWEAMGSDRSDADLMQVAAGK